VQEVVVFVAHGFYGFELRELHAKSNHGLGTV
jgi:hypothetical protein